MSTAPSSPETQRYALVTGGGSGLGREFCLRLARDGWHVGVTDIDLVAAEKTVAEIASSGGTAQVELLDVTKLAAWQQLAQRLQHEWPRLDLLVNNAGICGTGAIGNDPLEQFDSILDVNFRGTLYGCQTIIPWMQQTASGGHLVNVASIFGLIAAPGMSAYNCSKSAIVALSETLYGELRPHGIGVTVVAPGFFPSNLVERGTFASDEDRQIAEQYTSKAKISAKEVVEQTLAAIHRGKLYVVLGKKSRWLWRLKRLLPNQFSRMTAWRYRKKLRAVQKGDPQGD